MVDLRPFTNCPALLIAGKTCYDAMNCSTLSFKIGKKRSQHPTETKLKSATKVGRMPDVTPAVKEFVENNKAKLQAVRWKVQEAEDLFVDNISQEDQMYGPARV